MSQNAYKSIFASDIFNTEQKAPETERVHKVKHNQTKSSALNEFKSQPEKKLRTQRSVGPQSDIFFRNKIDVKEPNRENRNLPHRSIVFSNLNSKDYVVKRLRDGKVYDPSSYYKEETPVKRRLKELYSDDELNYSDGNISLNRRATSRGFIEKETISQQPIPSIRDKLNKKKLLWQIASSSASHGNDELSSSQIIKMSQLKSNIFNDPQKEKDNKLNRTVGQRITYKEKNTVFMSPKHVTRTKWSNKLDWKSPKTELLFKTANEKEEEKRNAFQRKHKLLYGSVPDFRNLPKEKEMPKENIDSYLTSQYFKYDKAKARRAYDNVSTGFDENFYKNNLKYTANTTNDHEYRIKEGKGIDITDIKQMFDTQGIHVYGILDDSSFIFGKNSYRFKIRENNKDNYDKVFNEVCERSKKEKGIEIEPIKKITVNKLKPQEFPCDNCDIENNNSKAINTLKKHKTEMPSEFKKRFSQEFLINNNYKNNCLMKYQNHIMNTKK